jgi:hypothetical protein
VKSPERKEWLRKAVAAYQRTLAIDSEDWSAHYGLGLALGDPAWGEKTLIDKGDAAKEKATALDPEILLKLARDIASSKTNPPERKEQALKLARDVAGYMNGERPKYQSRLEPLHELAETLGPVWERETEAEVQTAIGRALEVTHKALHERLKPDETAEGRAFAAARSKDAAANMNAQSIVIHPLHRDGTPGIDRPVAAGSNPSIKTALSRIHQPESGE